jgi:hypothetical protein
MPNLIINVKSEAPITIRIHAGRGYSTVMGVVYHCRFHKLVVLIAQHCRLDELSGSDMTSYHCQFVLSNNSEVRYISGGLSVQLEVIA